MLRNRLEELLVFLEQLFDRRGTLDFAQTESQNEIVNRLRQQTPSPHSAYGQQPRIVPTPNLLFLDKRLQQPLAQRVPADIQPGEIVNNGFSQAELVKNEIVQIIPQLVFLRAQRVCHAIKRIGNGNLEVVSRPHPITRSLPVVRGFQNPEQGRVAHNGIVAFQIS